jgi:hypothetical protein
MFKDTGRGFHITFANGWTVSVQWNPGNYCTHRNNTNSDTSETAEVYAWKGGKTHPGDVEGWVTPNDVADFINTVSNFPNDY